MGKLRFTLTYLLFWIIIAFSCLLAENFSLLTVDHMGGMQMGSLFMLSFFIILLLVFYYILERKHNKIKIDTILLCIIATFGLISILTIVLQPARTFSDGLNGATNSISFSSEEKFAYVLQVIIWCAVLYGVLYAITRYSISRRWLKWLAFIYIVGLFICALVDVFMEADKIAGIFNGNYLGDVQFVIYNSNVWGHLLLIGVFSCVVLCLKRFKIYYYIPMMFFVVMIVFTSCATATFVSLAITIAYTIFEIVAMFYKQRKKLVTYLFAYIGGLIIFAAVFALMVIVNVNVFANFWQFVYREIIHKDYSTLTSRTGIWASVFGLLSKNPIDFIFGLGYRTGNAIFTTYYMTYRDANFAIRSTHNGVIEIFLRHGLLGVLMYAALLLTFVFGLAKLIKIKQYRVAYLYSLCFVGILAHSIAESTTFFTPNIGGMYITLIFFLPVAKETKYNHLKELNRDLQYTEIVHNKVTPTNICYFINSMLIGLIIAMLSVFLCKNSAANPMHNTEMIICIAVACFLMVGLIVPPLYLVANKNQTVKNAFKYALLKPIFDGKIVIAMTIASAVISEVIFQAFFELDLFARIMFCLYVFAIYSLTSLIFYKKDNCPVLDEANNRFTVLLTTISREVPYE